MQRIPFDRVARLILSVFAATFTTLIALPALATDPAVERQAQALQKKAVEEDSLNINYPEAIKKLAIAISKCAGDKCNSPLMGTLYRDLGAMLILSGSVDDGRAAFAKALGFDASLELDASYRNQALEQQWSDAKKKAGVGEPRAGASGPPGAASDAGTQAEGTSPQQPTGDFAHVPVPAQLVRTPVPIYAEYPGKEKLLRVVVKYRGAGMSDWKSIDLRKVQTGYGGVIPCSDVAEGRMQYYLQGYGSSGDAVAGSGNRNKPYAVPIQSELSSAAPALPGEDAPKQCSQVTAGADCPPDFPACHAPKKAGGEECAKNDDCESGACTSDKCGEKKGEGEECEKDEACASGACADGKCTASKKAVDEACDSDDQCTSSSCKDGKCAEGGRPKSGARKIWIGVSGSLDVVNLPAAENVCIANTVGYSCFDATGTVFPADAKTAMNIRQGPGGTAGDAITGGFSPGNLRLALSFDYAFGMNVLVGARAGYVLLAAPGSAFAPIHLEARVSLLIGKDALAKAIAPMLLLAAGAGEFDASFPVTAQLISGGSQGVSASLTAGPFFAAAGVGARFLLGPTVATTFAVKGEGVFGSNAGFLFGIAPELGMQLGL